MTKVGYGIFRAEPRGEGVKAKGRSLTPNLERATKLLSDAGINFMLTGYSVLGSFIHLFPRRTVHLVYVGAGRRREYGRSARERWIHGLAQPEKREGGEPYARLDQGGFVRRQRKARGCLVTPKEAWHRSRGG